MSGWCRWMRALGSANRLPLLPAMSSTVPKLAVRPTASVDTGGLMYCMVS